MIEQIVEKFLTKRAYLEMGAGKLAKQWKCTKDDIYLAKEKARAIISAEATAKLNQVISDQEEVLAKYVGSTFDEESLTKRFESKVPLSPKQIEELVQVDNVKSKVVKISDRLLANGTWTYSVDIKNVSKDFYNKEELQEKLKEIFPAIKAQSLPIVKNISSKALVILLSDDHAGAVVQNSMFGNEWNKDIYTARLLKISEEVKKLPYKFEEIHVLSLGDQMNGWNSQTTRGGHEVKSLSNKDQFDIYTEGRVAFYNDLFTSGMGAKYFVHDVENSNHTGLDFSYMANKFLEMYISSKFPEVKRKSYFLPIESFDYGIHTIAFTHGKDEKLMTRPMPLRLDYRTDLFLFQLFDKKGLSPSDRRITLYKGDLHSYAVDKGKFGRYINIPSLMGSTDWTEINFGDSEPGALLEILEKDNKTIQHIPLFL